MACILKLPEKNSKGVVVFTDMERDRFSKDKLLHEKILLLKDRWVVGLHHNLIDCRSDLNKIFDFAMSSPGQYNGDLPLVPFAACNFAPEYFHPSQNEKFWDILFVARAIKFKKVNEFLQCIRKLYDLRKKYRVMFICPIPRYKWMDRKTVVYNIREIYDGMFSEEEKDLFTLLTADYREPFPFDRTTLAHFYKSSRIFVHSSKRETQGRVGCYAWASGMPVVGFSCMATTLPDKLKIKPYFYEAKSYDDFPSLIEEAILSTKNGNNGEIKNWSEVISVFSESSTKKALSLELEKMFSSKGLAYVRGNEALGNLDTRVARHHSIESNNSSVVMMSLHKFTDLLKNEIGTVAQAIDKEDPEAFLASLFPVQDGKKNFIFNFFKKIWLKKHI